MKRSNQVWTMGKFRQKIFLAAFVLIIIPTVISYFAVRGVLSSILDLGMDRRIESQLDLAGKNLKDLAKFDSENESLYKQQFLQLQEVKRTYTFLLDSLPSMHRIYLIAYLISLGIGLITALAIATWLNRKIIQSHQSALDEMKVSQDQIFYLENRESWRLVAQKLVHEIKNPLTPIQVMVSRLPAKYLTLHSHVTVETGGSEGRGGSENPIQEFKSVLDETKQIVTEEIQKINAWIEAFSKYARMPEPKISQVDLKEYLLEFQQNYGSYWDHLLVSVNFSDSLKLSCSFDPMLIKQVLFNLAKNSAESVTGRQIDFSIHIQNNEERGVTLVIRDNGPGIPVEFRELLFQPNISSKGSDQPRGFGLAIVKKILLEHGGDIRYLDLSEGCGFEIFLPNSHAKLDGSGGKIV